MASVNYSRLKDAIRADIIAGDLPSGSRLRIPALSERYGVSSIPLREALQALSGEGLVIIEPNRGATVRQVDHVFMEDIYEIRSVLEEFIARRFVAIASDDDIENLRQIHSEMEAADDRGDSETRHSLDIAFHRSIAGSIDNSEVGLIVSRHTNIIDAVMRRFGQSPGRIIKVREEHRLLLKAFSDRDAEVAARVVSDHFRHAKEDLSSLMRKAARSPA